MTRHRRVQVLAYLLGAIVLLLPLTTACLPPLNPPAFKAAPAVAAGDKGTEAAPGGATNGSQDNKETANPVSSKEPYKIGLVNSFTGSSAHMGIPERDAVLMVEDKINRNGGINGRPIKVIAYDDESNESKGVLALRKLIAEDKVLGIIGTASSGVAMAQSPIAEEAHVPFIAMNSSYSVLTNPVKKWVFKIISSEKFLVGGIYEYLKGKGITSFAWMSPSSGFGQEARKYMQDTASKEGFNVVANEEYGANDTDMKPQLTKIRAINPQALVVYGAEAAGAIAIRQARELGINAIIISPPSMTLSSIMGDKQFSESVEGAILVSFKPDMWEQLPDNDPQKKVNQDLDKSMRAKYGDTFKRLEWPMGVGYDAFTVMTDAIKKANPDTSKMEQARSKVRDAIEQTKGYMGASSITTYTASDHEGLSWNSVVIGTIKGGKYQLIK